MEETELVLVTKGRGPTSEELLYMSLRFFGNLPNFVGAVCATVDPEIFFPPTGGHNSSRIAKSICGKCPVIVICRNFALEHKINFGVWGGTTVSEREAIRALIGEGKNAS